MGKKTFINNGTPYKVELTTVFPKTKGPGDTTQLIGMPYDPGHAGTPLWSIKYKGQKDEKAFMIIASSGTPKVGDTMELVFATEEVEDRVFYKGFTKEQYEKENAKKPFGGGGGSTKHQAWATIYATHYMDARAMGLTPHESRASAIAASNEVINKMSV
jgi:hypothetical protein